MYICIYIDIQIYRYLIVSNLAPLDGQHAGKRHPNGGPLGRRLGEPLEAGHDPGRAHANERARGEPQAVAVVRVEVGGRRAAALVTEVVVLRRELGLVLAGRRARGELSCREQATD